MRQHVQEHERVRVRWLRWKRGMLLGLALLLATAGWLSAPATTQAQEWENELLGSFESAGEGWTLNLGTESPGAAGTLTRDAAEHSNGAYSARLTGDFTGGGAYVSLWRSFTPIDGTTLTLRVKASGVSHVGIRLRDSTNQVHRQRIPLQATNDWQTITITDFDSGIDYQYFNGANDGVWHGPAQRVEIMMEKSRMVGGALTGTLWVDDVSLTVPADYPSWTLGGFEQEDAAWSPNNGAEFPGAVVGFTREMAGAYSGQYGARLHGDFSGGGNYVQVGRAFDPIDIRRLSFWARSDEATWIGVRLTDSTGQVHQQRVAITPNNEWQHIVINQFAGVSGGLYFSGANDGVWHGPATRIAFLLEKTRLEAGATVADLWLDDIEFRYSPPPLQLSQAQFGNVFLQGEPIRFGAATMGDTLSWIVRDEHGAAVDAGQQAASGLETQLTLPAIGLGYYTLHVTASLAGQPIGETQQTSFAVLSADVPALGADSPFGVATHLARVDQGWSLEQMELIRRAGLGNFRDEIPWSATEQPVGTYVKIDRRDAFMQRAAADGVAPLIALDYTHPAYDEGSTPHTPAGFEGFANYGSGLLDLYAGQLDRVEVYNEFNGDPFGRLGPLGHLAGNQPSVYYGLLKKTYETIKADHPDTIVVGAATAGIDFPWLEQLFALGGLQYMDVLSVHPYRHKQTDSSPESLLGQIAQLNALVEQYNGGVRKPIWFTEMGWPSHEGLYGIDELMQASYLVRSMAVSLASGIEKMYWYDLMNDGVKREEQEDNFGITRFASDPLGGYAPKPAYVTFAVLARQMGARTYAGQDALAAGAYSYRFENAGDEPVRIAWAKQPRQVAIAAGGTVRVTDMTGREELYEPYRGYIYLTLTDEPVYIAGAVTGVSDDATYEIDGGPVIIGESPELSVQLHNGSPDPVALTLRTTEDEATLTAAAGQTGQQNVQTQAYDHIGRNREHVYLWDGVNRVGRLTAIVETVEPARIELETDVTQAGSGLERVARIRVINQSPSQALTVDDIDWTIGSWSGSQADVGEVAAGGVYTLEVPLTDALLWQGYASEVTVTLAEYPAIVSEQDIYFNPILDKAPPAAGTDGPEAEAINLSMGRLQGSLNGVSYASSHGGSSDLSGLVWLNWDSSALYVTARIQDDTAAAPASAGSIWQNDSIQFTLAAGKPDETGEWYEMGMSLTPDGPQLYRWRSAAGEPSGLVADRSLAITRDEQEGTTLYRLTLPWSQLAAINPADGRRLSFSLLVNDNDGQGRRGYLEWGSGIGSAKSRSLFRETELTRDTLAPSVTLGVYGHNGGGAVTLNPGGSLLLSVGASQPDAGQQLGGVIATVQYDAARFEYTGAESVRSGLQLVTAEDDSGSGQLTLVAVALGEQAAITGDTELLRAGFRVRENAAAGQAAFTAAEAWAGDAAGGERPLGSATLAVTVAAASAPVDKTALTQALTAAGQLLAQAAEGTEIGDYIPGTLAGQTLLLHAAIDAAAVVAADGAATSSEVSQALTALQTAVGVFNSYRITASTGDVNGDGRIGIGDLTRIGYHYGKTSAHPDWLSAIVSADVNRDGLIDIADLALAAARLLAP